MSGDGNQAVFIGTFLSNGETVALCSDCFPAWLAAGLQAATGVDTSIVFELERQAEEAATAAEGAPTDEPPAPAPADPDHDEGWVADRFKDDREDQEADSTPPKTSGNGGRSRKQPGSAVAATGGNNDADGS